MNLKNHYVMFSIMLLYIVLLPASASGLRNSGKTDINENPFIAYGFNPGAGKLTGYLLATRIAPGRTDECKLVFAGKAQEPGRLSVKYFGELDSDGRNDLAKASAALVKRGGDIVMRIAKDTLQGDCEWILPFIGEPRIGESPSEVFISLGSRSAGPWSGVYVIKSSRARFHGSPDDSSLRTAYLVEGDIIYIYDEKPGWYYVKYDGRKGQTVGWIKKSDTVQVEG